MHCSCLFAVRMFCSADVCHPCVLSSLAVLLFAVLQGAVYAIGSDVDTSIRRTQHAYV